MREEWLPVVEEIRMLAYRREGSGPPLLLIHGWGVRYTIWKNLAPLLRPHFSLIMVELPGVGGSPPPDPDQPYYPACADRIDEVRQHLGIEQWALLAYSSGTRAAEAYVQRYPKRVSRVVFLCPAYLTELSALGLRLAWWVENTRPELTGWVLSDWRLRGLVQALGFNGRGHGYARVWTREIGAEPLENLKRMLYELPGRGRTPFELPPVPTLFIYGNRDALMARPRRRAGPNHVSIPASHSAPMLKAHDVAEVVKPFLAQGIVVPGSSRWRRLRTAIRLTAPELAELRELRELLRRERDQFGRLLRGAGRGRVLPRRLPVRLGRRRRVPGRRGRSHPAHPSRPFRRFGPSRARRFVRPPAALRRLNPRRLDPRRLTTRRMG
jgi:pimeloyl-ACP methyl ester carboxylesterase